MSSEKRKITILGVTGSVGQSAVDVVLSAPERFSVYAVTANTDVQGLAQAAVKIRARLAVIGDEKKYAELKQALSATGIEARAGTKEIEAAAWEKVDVVLAAIVGFAGLRPIIAAIEGGNNVAIANKEPLVAAGEMVMALAARRGVKILPVDSEHNAVFQVFESNQKEKIEKIILTASGGPFLDWDFRDMEKATVAQAVAHPNWQMGRKISVDSATMMNKALEIIEAHYLFGMPPEKIDVIIHPQSVIHSMVAYADGSILSQMGASDMRTPVTYALAWPERMETCGRKLDLEALENLSFRKPDFAKFPALSYAYECLENGQAWCIAMNAANEVAVEAFLAGKIGFGDITRTVRYALDVTGGLIGANTLKSLEEIEELDSMVRGIVTDRLYKNHGQERAKS